MTSFTDVFNNAADDGYAPGDDLADGKYKRLRIISANAKVTKGAGKPMFGFLLKNVEEGHPLEGDTVWLNQVFTAGNPEAESIFKRVMQTQLGITGEMLDADSDRAVNTVVGHEWSAEIVTKGEWQNVYLGKRQAAAEGGNGSSPTQEPTPAVEVVVEQASSPAPTTSDPAPEAFLDAHPAEDVPVGEHETGKDIWDI